MAVAADALVRDQLFIGGEWVDPTGSETIDVINPSTEEVVGRIPAGTAEDADRAVRAARAAFDAWSQVSPYDRAALCGAIGAKLAERGDELAALIATEMGMPLKLARMIQAGLPAETFAAIPQLVEQIQWEEAGRQLADRARARGRGRPRSRPWNYPLHQIALKVAPALAAGCTVVVKPTEVVPLNAFVLAEIVEQVGLPPGVFNLVTGTGPVVGEALAAHPLTSTWCPSPAPRARAGASGAGRADGQAGRARARRQVAERDPRRRRPRARGRPTASPSASSTPGRPAARSRACWSRASGWPRSEQIAAATADAFTPGDPFDGGSRLGPLVSDAQRERVRGYIERGQCRGREARHRRRRAARGSRAGVLRAPDGLLRRHDRHDDRPGGDLRPGAGDHALRQRGRRGRDRQRHDVRARRRRLVGRRASVRAQSRAGCAPVRSRSTAAPSTRWRRSGASSSPGTAARPVATASRSTSSRSRCSSDREPGRGTCRAPRSRLYSSATFRRRWPSGRLWRWALQPTFFSH